VFLNRVLQSAVANATRDPEVNLNRLIVWRAFTDGGPLHQGRLRWRPGPMGRAMPIRKRTSHITIVVADPTLSPGERPADASSAPQQEGQAGTGGQESAPARKPSRKGPGKGQGQGQGQGGGGQSRKDRKE
jgi:hypothetical protein